jgi:MFS family permease
MVGHGFTQPFLFIYLHSVRHISSPLTGLVLSTLGVVGLALSPLVGSAVDRFGARPVQLVALVVSAAGSALITQIHSVPAAFLAIAVSGAGNSATWVSMNAMLAGVTDGDQRQRAFALQFTLLNLGFGLGGIGGGLIARTSDVASFQTLYWIDAASFVVAALVVLTLRGVGRPVPHPIETSTGPGGWRQVLADRPMRLFCVIMFLLFAVGYAQIDSGFPAFADGFAHVSTRVIGLAFAANTVLIVLGQMLVLARLKGHRRTRAVMGFAALIAVSWTMIGLSSVVPKSVAAALVIAAMAVFATGETLWSPTGNALVNELAPAHLRGRYNALGSLMTQLATIAGPLYAGAMLGARLVPQYIGSLVGACLVAMVVAMALERRLTPAQNGVGPVERPVSVRV